MRSANSTSVTSAPKSRYMLAHSTPMAPAPTMVTRPGTSPRVSASSLVMIRRPSGLEARQRAGSRAGRQDQVVGGRLEVARLATRDADAGRAGQHAVAAQDGDLVLLHQEFDTADVLVDHEVAALGERPVVEGDAVVAGEPELGALLGHPMQQVGGLEQRLGRDAAPVQAGAAEPVALDEAHRQAKLRGANGAHVAHAAAEDEQVEALLFGHESPGGVVQLVAAVVGRPGRIGVEGASLVLADQAAPICWYRHRPCRGVVVGDEH